MKEELDAMSNLITEMTLRGATKEELVCAIQHSKAVIDAAKSEIDNGISLLKKKYLSHLQPEKALFYTYEEAKEVLNRMQEDAHLFGLIGINEYYDLCGRKDKTNDYNRDFGWSSSALYDAKIVPTSHGYMIDVPMAERI